MAPKSRKAEAVDLNDPCISNLSYPLGKPEGHTSTVSNTPSAWSVTSYSTSVMRIVLGIVLPNASNNPGFIR